MEDTQQRGQDKEGRVAEPGVSRTGEEEERHGTRGYRQGNRGTEVGMQEESHRHHICRSHTILN